MTSALRVLDEVYDRSFHSLHSQLRVVHAADPAKSLCGDSSVFVVRGGVLKMELGLGYFRVAGWILACCGSGTIASDSLTPAIMVCRFSTLMVFRVATVRIFGEKGTAVP